MGRRRIIPREIVAAARREAAGKPHGALAIISKKYGYPLFRAIRGYTHKDVDVPPVTEYGLLLTAEELREARRLYRAGQNFRGMAIRLGITKELLTSCLARAFLSQPDDAQGVGGAARP